jgi:hypothetical protein
VAGISSAVCSCLVSKPPDFAREKAAWKGGFFFGVNALLQYAIDLIAACARQ